MQQSFLRVRRRTSALSIFNKRKLNYLQKRNKDRSLLPKKIVFLRLLEQTAGARERAVTGSDSSWLLSEDSSSHLCQRGRRGAPRRWHREPNAAPRSRKTCNRGGCKVTTFQSGRSGGSGGGRSNRRNWRGRNHRKSKFLRNFLTEVANVQTESGNAKALDGSRLS